MATVNYRGGSTPRGFGSVASGTPLNVGMVDPVRTHGAVELGHAVVFADESGRRIKDGGAMITSETFADIPDGVPVNAKELTELVVAMRDKLKG